MLYLYFLMRLLRRSNLSLVLKDIQAKFSASFKFKIVVFHTPFFIYPLVSGKRLHSEFVVPCPWEGVRIQVRGFYISFIKFITTLSYSSAFCLSTLSDNESNSCTSLFLNLCNSQILLISLITLGFCFKISQKDHL
jgi:hypothetical protein